MAVVYDKELFSGRRGADNIGRQRSYVRVFEVRTDDPEDDAYTVGPGAGGIPRNGDAHPSDPAAVMMRINADQSDLDSTLWQVTCEYESSPPEEKQQREAISLDPAGQPFETPGYTSGTSGGGGGSQTTRESNPLDRPARISVRAEQATEICRVDRAGDAIVNSTGIDPFDPPPTIERSYPIITIAANVRPDSDALKIASQPEWQDLVNSDTPWGAAVGTMRIVGAEWHSAIENDVAFAEITLSIKVRRQGWKLKILDAGFRELSFSDIRPITDEKTGELVPNAVLLDGAGVRLPAGDTPVFLEYDIYDSAPLIPILALLGITA